MSAAEEMPAKIGSFTEQIKNLSVWVAKAKLQTMIQNRDVFRFPGGITAGGQALLSIHFKNGPQRFESLLVHHDDPEGNKSAVGVQWNEIKAPPDAAMDSDLLPWN